MQNMAYLEEAKQKAQETDVERESRKAADFEKIESRMPERWSTSDMRILDFIASLLGRKNFFSRNANPKDNTVWILDNTAYRPVSADQEEKQPWQAEFVTCFFGKNGKDLSKQVAVIADILGIDGKKGADAAVTATIAERLQPFCTSIAPSRSVTATLPFPGGESRTQALGPSGVNGISSQVIASGSDGVADGTVVENAVIGNWVPTVTGKTRFVGPDGWAVISDIDDTIKYTQTSHPEGILRTTFCETPQVIADMPYLYTLIRERFNPAYFYLSASPYNLYPFLTQFLEDHYPGGMLILRDDSWQALDGLLKSLTQGVQAYKVDRMDKMHSWIPRRKMICFGDSTQSDPEAYGEIYHKYPGWIHAIFIRKVTNIPHMENKNKDERFTQAFEGVDSSIWKVFEKPEECEEMLNALTG